MNKNTMVKFGLAGLTAFMLSLGANAADLAAAAGTLAEISTISTQAKANLAEATLGGDVDEITEMSKRSDAVDAAVAEAQDAYAAMERALAAGDQDAADSAGDGLAAALQKAQDALNGNIPPPPPPPPGGEQWTNTGGGPGGAGDPPNIYNVPSNTETVQAINQGQYGTFFASGQTTGDRDATPE